MQSGLNHFGIVEYHQTSAWQVGGERGEHILTYFSMPVNKQLRLVAYGKWKFGDAFVGKRIIEVANLNMFGIVHDRPVLFKLAAKVQNTL